MLHAFPQACREFVNRNKACPTANKSPELLAKYADGLLKKSNKASEDADLEQSLTDTVRFPPCERSSRTNEKSAWQTRLR